MEELKGGMRVERWAEGKGTGMASSANLISSLSSNPNQRNPFSPLLPPPLLRTPTHTNRRTCSNISPCTSEMSSVTTDAVNYKCYKIQLESTWCRMLHKERQRWSVKIEVVWISSIFTKSKTQLKAGLKLNEQNLRNHSKFPALSWSGCSCERFELACLLLLLHTRRKQEDQPWNRR